MVAGCGPLAPIGATEIAGVSPVAGPACAPWRARVLGSGFQSLVTVNLDNRDPATVNLDWQVRLGDAPATEVTRVSMGELDAMMPASEPGTYPVSVISPGGAVTTLAGAVTIVAGSECRDMDADGRDLVTYDMSPPDLSSYDLRQRDLLPSDLTTPDLARPPIAFPASCRDIKTNNPNAADGSYTIYYQGNSTRMWVVYCYDLAVQPREYLPLPMVGPNFNFSQYSAGGASPGNDVATHYQRVRIDPATLLVEVGDARFAASSGMLRHGNVTPVTSVSYGVAMDCLGAGSATGVGNVDLRGTPFAVIPGAFALGGFNPGGFANYSNASQVANLKGGGNCGWVDSGMLFSPYNGAGGFILQLTYR